MYPISHSWSIWRADETQEPFEIPSHSVAGDFFGMILQFFFNPSTSIPLNFIEWR